MLNGMQWLRGRGGLVGGNSGRYRVRGEWPGGSGGGRRVRRGRHWKVPVWGRDGGGGQSGRNMAEGNRGVEGGTLKWLLSSFYRPWEVTQMRPRKCELQNQGDHM